MRLSKTLRTAVEALMRNKMRAVLTALGIIIGIAAVIVMVELGKGSSTAIQKTISSMGANNVLVVPGTAASGGVSYGSGSILTLTAEDADALLKGIPFLKTTAPIVRARGQVVYGNKNWVPQNIYGTTPNFLIAREWLPLNAGEMFSEQDVRNGNKVCVLGQTLVRELFGDSSPLGEEIRIQNISFKVVGVLGSKGANMMGSDQDDIILAPWTTIKYRVSGASTSSTSNSGSSSSQSTSSTSDLYPTTSVQFYPSSSEGDSPLLRRHENVDQIMLAVKDAENIPSVLESAKGLLRERHRLRIEEPDDFILRDMTEMTKALSSTSALMTKLLLSVACISLLVGGVGIMNIMLVSVTERTREIGLRMAVGARPKDILQQFLVEAVVLCLSGGALGVILGRAVSSLVTALLSWPTESSLSAMMSAFVVSVSVGLVFGYYPAMRAAKLNPIDALRYE